MFGALAIIDAFAGMSDLSLVADRNPASQRVG